MENIYSHFVAKGQRDPDYMFYFEGKWRTGKTLALMLKRRHAPEVSFISIKNGRRLTVVVGTWDMTRAEWEARKVTAGYTLHFGSIFDVHDHAFSHGECQKCRMGFEAYSEAVYEAMKAHGVTL